MKKILLLSSFLIFSFLLTGCLEKTEKLPIEEEFDEYGLIQWPNGTITLNDFKKVGKIEKFDEEYIDRYLEGDVCKTEEEACVDLCFDEDDILLAPSDFWRDESKRAEAYTKNHRITDLNTFREVTGLKEATTEYVESSKDPNVSFSLEYILNNTVIYMFDVYVKSYQDILDRKAAFVEWMNKPKEEITDNEFFEKKVIPTFEELDDVVGICRVEDYAMMDFDITKRAFIVPYKNGYIGYIFSEALAGWSLKLIYNDVKVYLCKNMSQSAEMLWLNMGDRYANMTAPDYPINQIYIHRGISPEFYHDDFPVEVLIKELDCDSQETCKIEADRYFYNLLVGNEEDEYFTKRLNKFKKDIDNGVYTPYKFWLERYNSCSEKIENENGKIDEKDSEALKTREKMVHECFIQYLDE